MMKVASIGKSKSSNKAMDGTYNSPRASPRNNKLEKTRSGSNFISRLTSMGSLRSKRTKSEASALQAAPTRTLIHRCEAAELEMAFKVFDANGDGQICISELGAVLRSLGGGEVTQQELELIMNDVDKNQDGFISLEEFKDVHNVGESEDPIREAFTSFDKDGNNLICAVELRAMMQSLGQKGHTLEDCRRMISCVDQDGDGFVDFQEFQHLLSAKS